MTGAQRQHADFCRRGHDLREPDSYYERSDGGRTCKTCRKASSTAWRAARRAKKQEAQLTKLIARRDARRAARGGDAQ